MNKKHYRAIISVPISSDSDQNAVTAAFEYAKSLRHPNSESVAGHTELVVEVADSAGKPRRVYVG